MADETTPLPTPPHSLTIEELVHLTEALRTLTNGVLDMRSSVVSLAEKISHLIASEQVEDDNIRELRQKLDKIIEFLFQASKDIAATAVEVKTTRVDLKRLEDSGSFTTVTEEDLRKEQEVTTVKAITVIIEKAKALPTWVKWFLNTSVGAGLLHLVQRIFHH